MKTELEVARDAVRTVYGDELADALEWAAAAVQHRVTLLSAARSHAGVCCEGLTHWPECRTARALHALDPEWSRAEVERAHEAALTMARQRSDGPRLTLGECINSVGLARFEAMFGREAADAANVMLRGADRLRPGELEAVADPARLTYAAGNAQFWPTPSRNTLLGIAHEDSRPLPNGEHLVSVQLGADPVAHADSPEAVTPPARPPPEP